MLPACGISDEQLVKIVKRGVNNKLLLWKSISEIKYIKFVLSKTIFTFFCTWSIACRRCGRATSSPACHWQWPRAWRRWPPAGRRWPARPGTGWRVSSGWGPSSLLGRPGQVCRLGRWRRRLMNRGLILIWQPSDQSGSAWFQYGGCLINQAVPDFQIFWFSTVKLVVMKYIRQTWKKQTPWTL